MSSKIYRYHLTITNNARYPISFIRKKLDVFCSTFDARIIAFEFDKPHPHLHILVEAKKFVDYRKAHRIFGDGLNIKFRPLYMYKDIGDVIEYIIQNIEELFDAFVECMESHGSGSGYIGKPTPYKPTPEQWERIRKSMQEASKRRQRQAVLIQLEEFIKRDIKEIGELLRKIAYLCEDLEINAREEIRPFMRRLRDITKGIRSGKYSRIELFNELEELYNNVFSHYQRLKNAYNNAVSCGDDVLSFDVDMSEYVA